MKKKRKTVTSNSRIKSHLEKLWLWSPERYAAIKRESNTCQKCGKKGSKKKGFEVCTCVHHIKPTNWGRIFQVIREELLVNEENLMVLCKEDHKSLHDWLTANEIRRMENA